MYDVIIIGAGVTGCAIARELSKYNVNACVLEKEEDVCCGTSKANSAIIHSGYDAAEGTLKAGLNVLGNSLVEELSEKLDFPFRRIGSLVVCTSEEDIVKLEVLRERGRRNGVKELSIIYRKEIEQMEPNISDEVFAALYAPSAGIVCPFLMTVALAENAYVNGIDFRFETEVLAIIKRDYLYEVATNKGYYRTRVIINAAGVYADRLHNMVSCDKISITPRKGEYNLFDKAVGGYIRHIIFQLPNRFGKGVLVTPTVHGNLLIGPNAYDTQDREGTNTTHEGLEEISLKASRSIRNIPMNNIITSFAGLRAHEEHNDFIIGEVKDAEGFFDVAGIESPGLSCAPAIGIMVCDMVRDKLSLTGKSDFIETRKGIADPDSMSREEWTRLIRENPSYGNIVCRCEMVSEGEILDAIHRPLGARSLDAIKRRTRAGMGRCQGGFCTPKIINILEKELGISYMQVTKSGKNSGLIAGYNKSITSEEG